MPTSHSNFTIYDVDDQKQDDIPYEEASELTFVTSPWSTKCLVYKDFLYNCHSSHGNKVYWRCHNYSRYLIDTFYSSSRSLMTVLIYRKKKEERCRARCLVSGGKIVSLTGGKHNHPPHTEKIQKIFKKEKERSKIA